MIRHAAKHLKRALTWRTLLRLVALTLIVALGTLFWLVGTESGSRVTIAWVSGLVPDFKVQHESGTLLGPLRLRTVMFRNKSRFDADDVRLDWSPAALLLGELHLTEVHVANLKIKQPTPAANASKRLFTLRDIEAPLDLYIENLTIDELHVARGEQTIRYSQVGLKLHWNDTELRFEPATIGMANWETTLTGTLTTAGDWPLDATLHFVMPRHGDPSFTLDGILRGPLSDVAVTLDSQGLVDSRIEGRVSLLLAGYPFRATLRADRAYVPPRAAPDRRATLDQLDLQAEGELLGALTLTGTARIDTPWSQPVPARLRAEGTWRGLDLAEITFSEPRFDATLITDYRWLNGQRFHGRMQIRHLDLALTNPALPSNLAGNLRIDGNIPPAPAPGKTAASSRFDIVVESLSGTLLERPVTISGPLYWQDARWTFNNLDLRQGENRMLLHGTLADEWDADAELTLGDLHTLVPAFTGHATGDAHLHGPPTDPHFAFRLDVRELTLPTVTLPEPLGKSMAVPPADWSVTGDATFRDVHLSDAHTVDAGFVVTARGHVDWERDLDWDLDTQIGDFPLARFAPDIFFPKRGGLVSGPFRTRGTLGAQLKALAIDTNLGGTFDEASLVFDTGFDWAPGRLDLARLHVQHGRNRLTASGAFDAERIALDLEADAPALEASLRDFAGKLHATVHAQGPRAEPDIVLGLDADHLRWRGLVLETLDATLQLVDGAQKNSLLALHATGIGRPARVARTAQRIDRLDLAAEGTRDAHRVDVDIVSGPLALGLDVRGSLADDNERRENGAWHGTLAQGYVDIRRWHWESVGEAELAWLRPGSVADSQVRIGEHCWTDSTARLCLTRPATLGRDGDVALEAFHLPVEALLADLLPLDTLIRGHIGGSLTADWKDGVLSSLAAHLANAEPLQLARVSDTQLIEVEDTQNGSETTGLELREIAQIERLDAHVQKLDGIWHSEASLSGADTGSLQAQLQATPIAGSVGNFALQGKVQIDGLRFAILEAFTYQAHHFGGTLDANFTLGGTRMAPHAVGKLALRDGGLTFTRLPLTIENFNLDGDFDGSQFRFDGEFHTPNSEENARLGGTFDYNGGDWHGAAELTGKHLAVSMLPEYRFAVSPVLHMEANREAVLITGEVPVPYGRIELKKIPLQSIRRSRDVVVIQEDADTTDTGGIGIRHRVDVQFLLGHDIRFKAFNGEGRLTGDLRVRSTPELPLLVDGELHVHEGKYRALGQQLKLKQADIIFNGPADRPLIDALAVREINDAAVREVGVRLSGPLHAPQSVLWSSPEMPPEKVLSWLTTGRPPATGPANLRGEAAQAALGLGMAQGSVLLSAAGQEIGLRDVQLSSTGEDDTSEVQVGTNVNERVFVGYNRRVFTGETSVLVRLQMTRRLVLEALSGVESAVDIFYTFEF